MQAILAALADRRRKLLIATVWLAASVGLTGCYGVAYTTNLPASNRVITKTNHFGIYGLIGHSSTSVGHKCPSGISRALVFHSALNIVFSVLSFGLYTPSTTEVVCAEKQRRLVKRDNTEDGEIGDRQDGEGDEYGIGTRKEKALINGSISRSLAESKSWQWYDKSARKWIGGRVPLCLGESSSSSRWPDCG